MANEYFVSEDKKWLWVPVQQVPFMGIEDGGYIAITPERDGCNYAKRIPNNLLNRNKKLILKNLEYSSFILGTFGVGAFVISLGSLYNWSSFISIVLAGLITSFQLYFFRHLKDGFSNK